MKAINRIKQDGKYTLPDIGFRTGIGRTIEVKNESAKGSYEGMLEEEVCELRFQV